MLSRPFSLSTENWTVFSGACSSWHSFHTFAFLNYVVAELPYNDYFEYFGPDFKLHISPSNMTNQNTQEYMDKIMYVQAF